jgi:hypothetical protein
LSKRPPSPVAANSRPLLAIATVPPLWLTGPVCFASISFRREPRLAFAGCFLERLNSSISMFRWLLVK